LFKARATSGQSVRRDDGGLALADPSLGSSVGSSLGSPCSSGVAKPRGRANPLLHSAPERGEVGEKAGQLVLTAWPPKELRIAASMRRPYALSSREANRAKSEAAIT
jgi:hypothetical protein